MKKIIKKNEISTNENYLKILSISNILKDYNYLF